MVEQQAFGSSVRVALASVLEDLGQAVVDIPTGVDRLSVLGRYGGHMARFREAARCKLFCNTSITRDSQVGPHLERPTQPIAALFRD